MATMRTMPTLAKLAKHHGLHEDQPHCFRCKHPIPAPTWAQAGAWLDRAHVIDRWAGGSDRADNLRPLCLWCHKVQPIFEPGDETAALAWFNTPQTASQDVLYMADENERMNPERSARNSAWVRQDAAEEPERFARVADRDKQRVMQRRRAFPVEVGVRS